MKGIRFITAWGLCFICLLHPIAAHAAEFAGLDVSFWLGTIDFDEVHDAGYDIVYIRAGYGLTEDSQFQTNASTAKEAGLLIGFYFYVTATDVYSAEQQAKYFVSLIEEYDYDCRPAVDFEQFGSLSNDEINQVALAFSQTLETETQVTPVFYSDASNASSVWDEALTVYPLWVADYNVSSPSTGVWSDWAGFQYTDEGSVPGVSGDTDLDYYTSAVLTSDLPFLDVQTSDWFYKDVLRLYRKQLMNGISADEFAPYAGAVRAAPITILYRLDGFTAFKDVTGSIWYTDAVLWAKQAGIAMGTNDYFYPNRVISREELCVFLYRYADYRSYDVTKRADLSKYTDESDVADWALSEVEWAVAMDLLDGTTDTMLSPTANVSRADLAVMIDRFMTVYDVS